MMDCTEVRDRLEAHVLEVLEAEEARACEAHLAFCDACRLQRAELEELLGLLGRLAETDSARPGLEERVIARTAGASDAWRWWGRAGLAAAAGILLAVGLVAAGYGLGSGAGGDGADRVALVSRLDDLSLQIKTLREEQAAQRNRDAERLARLEANDRRHESRLDDIQVKPASPKDDGMLARVRAQESRIKDLEKQLADTIDKMAALRDQTIETFLKVASTVSNPLVRN